MSGQNQIITNKHIEHSVDVLKMKGLNMSHTKGRDQ